MLLLAHKAQRKSRAVNAGRISHLPRKHQHTRNSVCSARSCGNADSRHLATGSHITLRRHGARLLMLGVGHMELRIMTECVVHKHCTAADKAEYVVYPLVCKVIGYYVGNSFFHDTTPIY